MARRLFNYEQKAKKRYDEVDHRGFTTGEERMSSSAHRRICTDYGVSCATVMQCVYRHVNKEKTAEITHDQILRETTISKETCGYCLDLLTIVGYLDCLRKGNSNNKTGERHASIYKINPIDVLSGKPTGRYNPFPDFDEERKKLQEELEQRKNSPIDEARVNAAYAIINGNTYQGTGLDTIDGLTEKETSIAKQRCVDNFKRTYEGRASYKMVSDLLKRKHLEEYLPQFRNVVTDYPIE